MVNYINIANYQINTLTNIQLNKLHQETFCEGSSQHNKGLKYWPEGKLEANTRFLDKIEEEMERRGIPIPRTYPLPS